MSVAWVGVGVAALGTVLATKNSSKATKAQTGAADQANDTTLAMFDQTRADIAPYRNTGARALDVLSQEMGLGGPATALSYEDWLKQNAPAGGAGSGGGVNPTASALKQGMTGAVQGLVDPVGGTVKQLKAGLTLGGLFGHKKKSSAPAAPLTPDQSAQADAQSRADYAKYLQDFQDTHATAPEGMAGDLTRDFTLADFQKDPGYQFRMDEGNKALERSAAARGGLLSGATLKATDRYNQDYASGEFSNAYNRFNNDRTTRFNRLSAIAGTGQTATTNLASIGTNVANTVADTTLQRGNAEAAGAIAKGNAINNGISTLGQFYLQNKYGNPAYYGGMRPQSVITADQGLGTRSPAWA
jgi:hypothetical protein